MFCPLDVELFPEDCRVTHLSSCDQWIYWIQKNGSTSLKKEELYKSAIGYRNHDIASLHVIDIYIRDARTRYVSGVHTYLEFLRRDHPELDSNTVLWFVKRYKFLNRHFLPQFFWLANLSRSVMPDTQLRIRDFNDFKYATTYTDGPKEIEKMSQNFSEKLLSNDSNMELWFFVDQVLLDLSGNTLTWSEIINHYKTNHSDIWSLMTSNLSIIMRNVLPKT
jgi:hypothetical protein